MVCYVGLNISDKFHFLNKRILWLEDNQIAFITMTVSTFKDAGRLDQLQVLFEVTVHLRCRYSYKGVHFFLLVSLRPRKSCASSSVLSCHQKYTTKQQFQISEKTKNFHLTNTHSEKLKIEQRTGFSRTRIVIKNRRKLPIVLKDH